ncbi:hypothetical protein, partial [Klebsiella pneumoniae]|uniref:hypothetical protein n=1 Tax=Klebsiella pneumoniae TaxID=573 RepID=UPI003B9814AF
AFYAVYHGPEGLKKIARRVHHLTVLFAKSLQAAGLSLTHASFFDTVTLNTGEQTDTLYQQA